MADISLQVSDTQENPALSKVRFEAAEAFAALSTELKAIESLALIGATSDFLDEAAQQALCAIARMAEAANVNAQRFSCEFQSTPQR